MTAEHVQELAEQVLLSRKWRLDQLLVMHATKARGAWNIRFKNPIGPPIDIRIDRHATDTDEEIMARIETALESYLNGFPKWEGR